MVGDESSKKGVLVQPDIFGIDSGRTKAIADQLSADGYLVVLPDVFKGWQVDCSQHIF